MLNNIVQWIGKALYTLLSAILILFVALFAYAWIEKARLLIIAGESIPAYHIIILIMLAITLAGFIARFFNPKHKLSAEVPPEWNQALNVCFSRVLPFALLAVSIIFFAFGWLAMQYIFLLGMALLTLAGWALWITTKITISLIKQTPQLTINSKGIWETTYGEIPWNDVQTIWLSEVTVKMNTIYTLEIKVSDIGRYLSRLPKYKYYLNKLEFSQDIIHIQLNRFDHAPQFIENCAKIMWDRWKDSQPQEIMTYEKLVAQREEEANQF